MAQKRMTIPLKLSSCAREREGASTWLEWGKPKETPGATQAPKLRQTLETARKNAKDPSGFAVLFRERINFGAQTNAKIITTQLPSIPIYFFSTLMLPQSWTSSTRLVTSKELCPHSWSIQVFTGCSWETLLFYSVPSSSPSSPFEAHLWRSGLFLLNSSPVLIRGKASWQLLNHSINLNSFPSQYSFFQTFCTSEDCTYLSCPHSQRDCGKCWGGEIDTKCKRNNQRSSIACGSSGLWVLAELTQLTIHTGKEYLQSLKNFIWKQRGNKGE